VLRFGDCAHGATGDALADDVIVVMAVIYYTRSNPLPHDPPRSALRSAQGRVRSVQGPRS
jgi:hypothetical protein